jgi:hypothetical protein
MNDGLTIRIAHFLALSMHCAPRQRISRLQPKPNRYPRNAPAKVTEPLPPIPQTCLRTRLPSPRDRCNVPSRSCRHVKAATLIILRCEMGYAMTFCRCDKWSTKRDGDKENPKMKPYSRHSFRDTTPEKNQSTHSKNRHSTT